MEFTTAYFQNSKVFNASFLKFELFYQMLLKYRFIPLLTNNFPVFFEAHIYLPIFILRIFLCQILASDSAFLRQTAANYLKNQNTAFSGE